MCWSFIKLGWDTSLAIKSVFYHCSTGKWTSQRRLCNRRSHRTTTSTWTRTQLRQKNSTGATERSPLVEAATRWPRLGTAWRSSWGPASRQQKTERRGALLNLQKAPANGTDSRMWSMWPCRRNRTAAWFTREAPFHGRTRRNMCRGRTHWLRWSTGSKFTKATHPRGQCEASSCPENAARDRHGFI